MNNSKPKNFEASLEELERIVRQLEQGELTLEKSLELFEQGVKLSRDCQEIWMGSGWIAALIPSGIPLRRIVHDGNRQQWKMAAQHPEALVDCVVEQEGDGG